MAEREEAAAGRRQRTAQRLRCGRQRRRAVCVCERERADGAELFFPELDVSFQELGWRRLPVRCAAGQKDENGRETQNEREGERQVLRVVGSAAGTGRRQRLAAKECGDEKGEWVSGDSGLTGAGSVLRQSR